jgi:deoxyribose-phosphate aldolase
VRAFRDACGPAHMKAILATGELGDATQRGARSMVAMMAGADFIKTSTGKEKVNATLPVSLVMTRAIRDYQRRTGHGSASSRPAASARPRTRSLADR